MIPMRILAVDDDPVFLMVLQQVLGSIGYRDLTFASSGSEAMELLPCPCHGFASEPARRDDHGDEIHRIRRAGLPCWGE